MDANTMRDQVIARLRTTNYDILNLDDREAGDVLTRAELEFTIRRAVGDLNAKRKGFEIDSKRKLDLSSLVTGHTSFKRTRSPGSGDFVLGNEDNGAMRTPDKDYQLQSIAGSSAVTVETDYGVFCRLPDECLFITLETCDTSKAGVMKYNVPVTPVRFEEYTEGLRDPYFSPYYNRVWRMDTGNWTPADPGNTDPNQSEKNLTGLNADGSATNLTISTERSVHLIPGKDWIVERYNVRYIKKPRRIVVDTISPANQVSSELHSGVHDEIVDIAVRLFISDRMAEQAKYPVAEKEQREDE
jgi:hypothetical protein